MQPTAVASPRIMQSEEVEKKQMKNEKEFNRVKTVIANYREKNNLPHPTDKEIKEIIRLIKGLN